MIKKKWKKQQKWRLTESSLKSQQEPCLGKAPSKVTDALPEPEPAGAMAALEGDEEDDEEDLEAMQSRLATLRS